MTISQRSDRKPFLTLPDSWISPHCCPIVTVRASQHIPIWDTGMKGEVRCMMQNCKLWSSYPNRHQLEKVSVPTWKDCVKKCLRMVWSSVWDVFFFLATSQEQSSTWSVPMLGVPIKPPREVSSQLLTVSERDRQHFWPEMMAQTELSQEQRTSNTKVICPWSAHMAKQAEGDSSSRAWLQWRKECCHHCQASPAPDLPGSWAQPQDFELFLLTRGSGRSKCHQQRKGDRQKAI